MTFTNQYFTEILHTEIFTLNMHLAKAEYNVYTTQNDNESRNLISWRHPPCLWNSENEIGDILKYYNTSASQPRTALPASSDHLSPEIGHQGRLAFSAETKIRLSFEIQERKSASDGYHISFSIVRILSFYINSFFSF